MHSPSWQDNLLTTREAIRDLIRQTRRIAVLGIKTEQQSFQPAFYVPAYLANAGFEIVPVPVYFRDATQILGRPVYRRLIDIPGEIDLVSVSGAPRIYLPTSMTFWRSDPKRYGSSPASATTRWPSGSQPRASGWCRIAA